MKEDEILSNNPKDFKKSRWISMLFLMTKAMLAMA